MSTQPHLAVGAATATTTTRPELRIGEAKPGARIPPAEFRRPTPPPPTPPSKGGNLPPLEVTYSETSHL
jgi:hypothetical protein